MAYSYKHGDRPLEGVTVQRAVGRGGFGEVYYALTDSGKQVAVKFLRDNPEVELRGIAHVMNLKSPHLITIYDVRKNEASEPFVIMEYVSGPSLRELLAAEPAGLGPQKAAFFLNGIGKGLSYLHERGIVHRDLKPANIFYDDGYVKIGDYGLSKHISVSAHSGNTVSVGTVHYMAPEIGSGSYSKAIDIYALGVMLFEMLTGRLPFTGSSMGEILMRHISDRPDLGAVQEPFRSVIAKALAKNPADRYQDVNEMIDAVVSVTEVSASMASFDPRVLGQTPRDVNVDDRDRTITTPGRGSPPPQRLMDLDARGAGQLPDIPPIPDVFAREGRKHSREQAIQPPAILPTTTAKVVRWPQFWVVAVVTLGISGVSAIVTQQGELFPAVAFMLFGGVFGSLFAHFNLVNRLLTPHALLERIVYATSACLPMGPGIMIAMEAGGSGSGSYGRLAMPLLAMILIFNWKQRIEDGRRQIVDGSSAFWQGFVGLIAGGIADCPPWLAAGLCASLTILTQTAAAMWPVADSEASSAKWPPPPPPQPYRAPRPAAQVAYSPPAPAQPVELRPTPAPAAQVEYSPAQPSFVGRSTNVGMSLLGKFLLLMGIVAAVGADTRMPRIIEAGPERTLGVSTHGYYYENQYTGTRIEAPRRIFVLLPAIGAALLVVARRRDGAAHVFRGIVGGIVAVGASALVLFGPGRYVIHDLLEHGPEAILKNDAAIGVFVALGLAILLILWPKSRGPRPIVI